MGRRLTVRIVLALFVWSALLMVAAVAGLL
jgi:hypothetical protein